MQVSSAVEVSDIKRARTLMKSMVNTNPKNAQGWIAYARVEEIAGNLKTARTLIAQVGRHHALCASGITSPATNSNAVSRGLVCFAFHLPARYLQC
jgi:predicted lipoprotein